ncbi:alpha/beta hydrolase fold protein [Deltaproteobacteria bacterium]|nr:alpha/beta hydrolase fold protein [Deltaproteobacteria bacterium]
MPTVLSSGVRLHYEVAGHGDPVLLIMGFAVPGSGWRLQVEALAAHHRVITFDNRGVGRSDAPTGLYSTDQMAADAVALLDHLSVEQAHVVGISMGGMIAQKLALRHRERVRTLALLATHGGGPAALPALSTLRRFLTLQRATDPAQRFRLFTEILFTPAFVAEHGDRLRAGMQTDLLEQGQSAAGFRGQMSAIIGHRTGARLGELKGLPTLLLHGEADAIVNPANARLLHQWMPWATLRTLPGVGHGINVQARDTVNQALLAHFR